MRQILTFRLCASRASCAELPLETAASRTKCEFGYRSWPCKTTPTDDRLGARSYPRSTRDRSARARPIPGGNLRLHPDICAFDSASSTWNSCDRALDSKSRKSGRLDMDQGQEPARQWPALGNRGLVNGECLRRGFSPALLLDHRRFGYSGDKSQRAVATRALIKFQPIASGDRSNGYECSCCTARDTIGFTAHGSNPPVRKSYRNDIISC